MEGRSTLLHRIRAANPLVLDSALALGLLALTLTETAGGLGGGGASSADAWWTGFFMATQMLPLAFRRRTPFTVFCIVSVSAIVYNVLNIPPQPFTEVFAVVLAVYTVSADARRDLALYSGAALVVAMAVLNLPAIGGHQDFKDIATQVLLLAGAWVVGDNARVRRRQTELLQERAERAEREREEQARVGALEERARIAREIHDVVAHSVSVIGIQAGAARRVVAEQPERARDVLASIERVSRDTMAELRRALGVLRESDEEAALAPQPGLGALRELVDQFRSIGLHVEVVTEGERPPLPSGLDLAAYRIVQEALTNALKHAGATAAQVLVRYGPHVLEVTVADQGRTPAPDFGPPGPDGNGLGAPGSSGGQGLVGMRERVAMFGGTLEAGPSNGGFRVKAWFPLQTSMEAS